MSTDSENSTPTSDPPIPSLADAGFEELIEGRPEGVIKRFFVTNRHLSGLAIGGLVYWNRVRAKRSGPLSWLVSFLAFFLRPFVRKDLIDQPFPVQLRRRLEILGPTYIKLGQILSLREDILPASITEELKNLLDRLPAVPYPRYLELITEDLGRPIDEMFRSIAPTPIGSASIAQSHRAVTLEGDEVVIKVVKPGIRRTLQRDALLLSLFGRLLQIPLSRFQPKRVLTEFTEYTLREVDLRREADNAETFAANFKDMPGVAFPKIYRKYSGRSVLCMEFFDGVRPDSDAAQLFTDEEKDRIIDLGAGSIINMLYRDGFFHADLHPGNLLIIRGKDGKPRAGFIDLGMVGRLDGEVRRTMLYYYYCLVTGDVENAARYLATVAHPAPGGDPEGFRREVEDMGRRWSRAANFEDFSLAQLILESVALGGQYRMYFPVEMVLMVKALVTFEGVGQLMKPGFDVASVSKKHISKLFFHQFSPLRLLKESTRGAPELIDLLVKGPQLVSEGLRLLEATSRRRNQNPLAGIRGTIFGGFCMVAGAVLAGAGAPWVSWTALFVVGVAAGLNKQS